MAGEIEGISITEGRISDVSDTRSFAAHEKEPGMDGRGFG
jgi:hypothetical protein